MKSILEAHLNKKTLVSIFSSKYDWDNFSFGRLNYISDEVFVLESYTKFGDRSGFEIRKTENVTKIESSGFYENYLAAMIEKNKPVHSGRDLSMGEAGAGFSEVICAAKITGSIVSIWADDADQAIVGNIIALRDDLVEVALLDRYGRKDGFATTKCSTVTAIDYETRDLQLIRSISELGV